MPSLTLPSASSVPVRSNADNCDAGTSGCGLSYPRSRIAWFLGIATLGCAADLLTKHWIFAWLGPSSGDHIWWLHEGYIGIQTTLNRGALFGMGSGGGPIFAGLSILAAISILAWLFFFGAAHSRWLTVALSLITGGILGNLYDRLGLWVTAEIPADYASSVRDWILFRAGSERWSWPNFNIADSLLVVGAGMLLWQAYWEKPAEETSPVSG